MPADAGVDELGQRLGRVINQSWLLVRRCSIGSSPTLVGCAPRISSRVSLKVSEGGRPVPPTDD